MLNPDLPIMKSEDDMLNRRTFAEMLAQVLIKDPISSYSFVLGLYGKWGSGKTSLLNMVFENIEKIDNKTIVFRFNPWLCSDPKQLIVQFFKQMGTILKMQGSNFDKLCRLIDGYAELIEAVNIIPYVGSAMAAVGKLLSKKARKHNEERGDLQNIKNQIANKLREENIKIIVSIDDIDRLSNEEIIAVFQLVKSLGDFPNTVYVLAFDYEVVVKALEEIQHGDGKEYLEKVIQVPFEIPAPTMTDFHNALFSKLNAILGDIPDEKWDTAIWSNLFQFGIKEYVQSIRDVIRYSNVFSLKYKLLQDETDPVDLLGLTCIQVFEQMLYSKLPYYKENLCGNNLRYSYESQKQDEEKVKQTIEMLVPGDGTISNVDAAKNILGILFPRTRVVVNSFYGIGRHYVDNSFIINNNIAALECFDRYFSLRLEDAAIPTSIVENLIYHCKEEELKEGVLKLYKEGKIERLLDEIQAHAVKKSNSTITSERAILLIRCLSQQWSSFKVDDTGMFSVPFAWRYLNCVDLLLDVINPDVRFLFIESIFEDEEVDASTLALLLRDFETKCGRFTERTPSESKQICSREEVEKLENIFKRRALEAIESGSALRKERGLNFLSLLQQLDPELFESKKKLLITQDISLVKIISYSIEHGTQASFTVRRIWELNKKRFEEFIDIEEAYPRIKDFVLTKQFLELQASDQMDVVAFLLSVENKTEDSAENEIYEEEIKKELSKLIEDNPWSK